MTDQKRGKQLETRPRKLSTMKAFKRFVINSDVRLVYFKEQGNRQRFYANGIRLDVPKKICKFIAELFDRRVQDLGTLKISNPNLKLLRKQLAELIYLGVCVQFQRK